MIETEEKSKTFKASDDSFHDRVDTLIEDLKKTNIDDTVENKCKTCQKTIKDDIDNNNILGNNLIVWFRILSLLCIYYL